jgi:cytochrome c553
MSAQDTLAYSRRHNRIYKLHDKATGYLCEGCCGSSADEWATIHGHVGLEIWKDFVPLCRSCHVRYDTKPGTAAARTAHLKGPKSAEHLAKISAAKKGKAPVNLHMLHTPEVIAKRAATRRRQSLEKKNA